MRDVDAIIQQLRLAYPGISVEQLAVMHPGADDDGLWHFRHPASAAEIQLESPTGNAPLQAVGLVVAGLGLTSPAA